MSGAAENERPRAPVPSSRAAEPDGRAEPAPRTERRRRIGFWLYGLHLFTLPSIAVSNGFTALTVLATPWAAPRRPPRTAHPLLWVLGVYFLLLVASIATSQDFAKSLPTIGEPFILATLVLALVLVSGERDTRRVVDGLVVVAGLVALLGLAQLLAGYGDLDRRIRGPFSHWMTFSHFLLICDLLLIGRLACRGRPGGGRALGLWRWLALAAINLALLSSLTRSAWVALFVTVTAVLALRAPRLLLGYLPVAVIVVALAPVPMLQRMASVFDLTDPSNYDRLCMTEAGLTMIAENPLLGIGPEMVEERYPIYRPPTAPRFWVPHLHNIFLQLAAERGLPALATYLVMVALSLRAAWRGFRAGGGFSGPASDLYLGALLALVAFNVGGLFENSWGDTEVQRLALFVLALPYCVATGDDQPAEGA